jgi:hypothetical protein
LLDRIEFPEARISHMQKRLREIDRSVPHGEEPTTLDQLAAAQ